MSGPEVDIAAQRFGRVVALSRVGKTHKWLCQCDCGKTVAMWKQNLVGGQTVSCGCFNREASGNRLRTHGKRRTRVYSIWSHVIQRCNTPQNPKFPIYGGRGIRVCTRWLSFDNFLADMGEPAAGMQIERIDNDGNYEPGNCRWATRLEQAQNKRTNRYVIIAGEKITLAEASRRYGINQTTLQERLEKGWDDEPAVFSPRRPGFGKESRCRS